MSGSLIKRGFCHIFGDGIPLDEGLIAFKYAIQRVTDPDELIPHLFEQIDPDFAKRVKPGDLVVAGKDFASGKPHVQGFIAMVALKMGLLCESMPHKSLRRAVAQGLPVLTGCMGIAGFAKGGHEVEVDFVTGAAKNLTTGAEAQFPAMPPILADMVSQGGAGGRLKAWLADHPELAKSPEMAAG